MTCRVLGSVVTDRTTDASANAKRFVTFATFALSFFVPSDDMMREPCVDTLQGELRTRYTYGDVTHAT